jgi:maltose-binding protein MalE
MNIKHKNQLLAAFVMVILSLALICIGSLHVRQRTLENTQTQQETVTLSLWYDSTLYEPYFQAAAELYQEKTGITVELRQVSGMEYIASIQQANVEKNGPDLYVTDSEYLQNLVRIGAASKTETNDTYNKDYFCEGTFDAMEYQDDYYGYPLGFDVTALMYNKELAETAPRTFQEIMDRVQEEGTVASQILAWDTGNFLYNYGFVAAYAQIGGENGYESSVSVDNPEMMAAAQFYQDLCSVFCNDRDYTYDEVKQQFAEGQLSYAIVRSDVLNDYETLGFDVGFASLPNLNGEQKTASLSVTDLLMVNGFSTQKESAVDFAQFVSLTMADQMYEDCAILPLAVTAQTPVQSTVFYAAYETSAGLPKLMATQDYWNQMREALALVRKGSDVQSVLESLQQTLETQILSE